MRPEDREAWLAKRIGWLNRDGRLFQAAVALHSNRMVARQVAEVIEANPRLGSWNLLLDWMFKNYYRQACVSVRRLMDSDRNCISLRRLADDVCSQWSVLTRTDYVARWLEHSAGLLERREHLVRVKGPDGGETEIDIGDFEHRSIIDSIVETANTEFDRFAGPGSECVSPSLVAERVQTAQMAIDKVKLAVDRHIAHLDKCEPDGNLTVDELDEAIDAVGTLYQYLSLLLTGSAPDPLEPVPQFDWEWIFDEPWRLGDSESVGS